MIYPSRPLTWREREDVIRSALARLPVATPLELICRVEGARVVPTGEQLRVAAWDLRTHGYTSATMPGFGGDPDFVTYIRKARWKEDAWPICPCCGSAVA